MTQRFIVSYGQHAADKYPTRHECSFEELRAWLWSMQPKAAGVTPEQWDTLTREQQHEVKTGPYLVFADFGTAPKADTNPKSDTFGQLVTGMRAYSHLELSYAVPIDLDAGDWTLARIDKTLKGYQWLAWTTFKHSDESKRWRVVVPVARGMNRHEHRATWEQLNAAFCGQADPAAKDATRLNYLPGVCLNPADFERGYMGELDGVPLAVVPAGTVDADGEPTHGDGPVPGWSGPEDDDVLVAHMLAHRSKAENAFAAPGTPTKFAALWYADAAALGARFPAVEAGQHWDHTKADLALANDLAYYTGGDMERVVSLLNASGLAQRASWRDDKARRAAEIACRGRTQYAFMRSMAAPSASSPVPVLASGGAAANAVNARHLCTDQKNAERLYNAYGNQVLSAAGEFFTWCGTHWEPGQRLALRFGCNLSAIIADELKPLRERHALLQGGADMTAHLANPRKVAPAEEWAILDELIPELQKWASKSEMASVINNALGLLKTLLDVPMTSFDTNPWLLNVKNGTIDLRTGAMKPHDPADRITRVIPIDYDPAAQAPRFLQFLGEIFADVQTRDYLHKYFGYSVTGVNREQTLLVHWGKGRNGKNTLHRTIRNVLGPYAKVGPTGLLTAEKDGQFIHQLAALYGARWVSVDESDDGARLKEAAMKQMTGDDSVVGRHLYKSFFEYLPTFKLHFMTNHKPRIAGTDYGVWRRLLLLPYSKQFDDETADKSLTDKLAAEHAGILAWLVAGAARYNAEGLKMCPELRRASDEYRQDEDVLGQWIDEKCSRLEGVETPFAQLYASYAGWARDAGAFILSAKRLGLELTERPLGLKKVKRGNKNTVTIVGLKLL